MIRSPALEGITVGRHKTVNIDLPPRMTARKTASGKVLFYYQQGRSKIPLGSDIAQARVRWADLENGPESGTAFKAIALRYRKECLPRKAPRTQQQQEPMLNVLIDAFGTMPLQSIRPMHVRQYLDRRTAKVAANREKALLSHIFNWARQVGVTDMANPCAGVERNEEKPREVYVTDEQFAETYARSPTWLQDAMDLALLTGQRMADLLKMQRGDIREGHLWVKQNKTGERLGIRIEGELQTAIERILARPSDIASLYLIHDHNGQRIQADTLRLHFRRVRVGEWQFRDLRAKTATDSGDIKQAQALLGHRRETTTAAVYRRVKGMKVGPLR